MNMKKVLLGVFLLGLTTSITYAQEQNQEQEKEVSKYNKWSIELAAGVHKPTGQFAPGYYTQTPSFGQASLGVRYMFNNKFGLKLEGGYATIENDDSSLAFKTANYRGSLQGVANLGAILNFNDWTNTFGLLLHAGGGFSMNDYKEPLDLNNDNMLHIMGGITPQIKMTNNLVLTGDVSVIGNTRQYRTWDGTQLNTERGVNGFAVNTSIGITYYLGKAEKHADWYFEEQEFEDTVSDLEERLSKVETDLIDSDQDGVPDYLDREPNTMSGVAVDSKGIAVDLNKNGIPDEIENSLDQRYAKKGEGGILEGSNNGSLSIKDLLDKGYVNVYFKFNSTTPETYSLEAINYLIRYMEQNPSVNAELVGFADEIGGEAYNNTLSEKRAKKVYDILVASGVSANRLTSRGGGVDNSVDKTSSPARQLVRRVTFRIK
ncbi:hypothetical protein GCM10008083_14220 [Ulvibacter litoralis]|nr:hypothetical protein GCM10008083_14220 [Ulvibacter litoralis]